DSLAGQEILRFTACLGEAEPPNRIPSSEAALASLQAQVTHAPDYTTSTAHKLLQVTKALRQLRDSWKITALTRVAHVRLLAVAILLANDSENDMNAQFTAWERVTFRIFGLARRDARTKVGEYTRLAHTLLQQDGPKGQDAVSAITSLGTDYSTNKITPTLRHVDAVHGWEDELRYFFYHYDQHLARLQGETVSNDLWASICQKPSSQVIELIYPEDGAETWPKLSEARQESRYYLGNVLITAPRVNLLTGQKDFDGKREVYSQFAEVHAQKDVSHETSWGYNQIVSREKQLLDWAKHHWAEP
ncbi:MAG: HNH endonuclease family protein, partial [Deinococcota bacterium]